MENVQLDKSFEGNNFSISSFHYKMLEYKWKIQNVACMERGVSYESPKFPADGEIKFRILFTLESYQCRKCFNLEILFESENENKLRVAPRFQIISGKGISKSAAWLFTLELNSKLGLIKEKLTDLLDVDDSFTVLCTIKISLEKMTTQTVHLPPCSLAENLGSLLSSGNLCDVTLVCSENKELQAHRAVLAARSPVFAAMFNQPMREAQCGRIVVSDVDSEVMQALLDFAYTDRIPSSLSQLAYKLLAASDKYDLARLTAVCEQHILETMTICNASATLIEAEQLHLNGLKQHVLRFMKANIHSIINTEGWVEATSKFPHIVSELFATE